MLSGSANAPRRMPSAAAVSPSLLAPGDGDTGLGAPCLGSAMDTYFKLNVTKQALGIPLTNNFISLDNGIGFNYTTDSAFVGYVYAKAIAAGKRVLVYEGDSDACGLQTAPIQVCNGRRRAVTVCNGLKATLSRVVTVCDGS